MAFSILFWNIWLDNQLDGEEGSARLLNELKRLADQYGPDFIGLNEVLQDRRSNVPFVLKFLDRECGYTHNHYTALSAHDDRWFDGAALCSRAKIADVQEVPLSKNSYAERRGYPGFKLKALAAGVKPPNQPALRIIVTHAMPLIPLRVDALKDHYEGTGNLNRLIRSKAYSRNTILIGDMNEPAFLPRPLTAKVADQMHFRTGSGTNHTWRHNARRLTPVRANLDYLYWSKDSDFTLMDFKVLASDVSDHKPLLATFQYQ